MVAIPWGVWEVTAVDGHNQIEKHVVPEIQYGEEMAWLKFVTKVHFNFLSSFSSIELVKGRNFFGYALFCSCRYMKKQRKELLCLQAMNKDLSK
jgi:hypothetical protein